MDSLPELRDGVDEAVSVVQPQLLLLGREVLGADGGVVPVVATILPRQLSREGGEEVVESPGQDDVVVAVQEEDDDARGQADTCGRGRRRSRIRMTL